MRLSPDLRCLCVARPLVGLTFRILVRRQTYLLVQVAMFRPVGEIMRRPDRKGNFRKPISELRWAFFVHYNQMTGPRQC